MTAIDVRSTCGYLSLNQCVVSGPLLPTQNSASGASIILAYSSSSITLYSCAFTGWSLFLKTSQLGLANVSQGSLLIYETQVLSNIIFSSPTPQLLFLQSVVMFNPQTLVRGII